jgi:4-diphosphocytidyl-2-C-methyl-D-erythritol kinase
MQPLTLRAPAKINLFLHVLGRRADGYHTIETLVAFTELADELTITPSAELSLAVTGDFAADAGGGDANLVMRAAQALRDATGTQQGAALSLTKHIPVGGGLGGGSADAAAALRGLNRFWSLGLNQRELQTIAATLGADVPMCLQSVPAIARGIGEDLVPLLWPLPTLYAVLVHPRVPLLTKDVYAAFEVPTQAPAWQEATSDAATFLVSLAPTRNHLQRAAIRVSGHVAELLLTLETLQPTPPFVRMTGSGACCYALFTSRNDADKAAKTMRKQQPHWWMQVTTLQTS